MSTNVHLFGNSLLGNLFPLLDMNGTNAETAKAETVKGKLEQQDCKVFDHTHDKATIDKALNGISETVVATVHQRVAYYTSKGLSMPSSDALHTFDFKPYENLTAEIGKLPEEDHFVAISFGFNDFNALALKTFLNPRKILGAVQDIQTNYIEAVTKVIALNKNVKPILVFQSRPSVDFKDGYWALKIAGLGVMAIHTLCIGLIAHSAFSMARNKMVKVSKIILILTAGAALFASTYVVSLKVTRDVCLMRQGLGTAMMGELMEKFYRPILAYAKEKHLPVLDLPNSFNPYNDLYSCDGIAPNDAGATMIAKGIKKIMGDHDYRLSKIYDCNDTARVNEPEAWFVTPVKAKA